MLLNRRGFLPGDPDSRQICPKRDIVARYGPPVPLVEGQCGAAVGYECREDDGEEYNEYVRELYERVHQRPLLRWVIPLHFARGLAVEASGGEVNWLLFAMQRCFTARKKTIFVPLEKYRNVHAPLPWINEKCVPLADPVEAMPRPRDEPPNVSSNSILIF